MPKLLALLVLLGGTVIYHIINKLVDWFLCKIWRLHTLTSFDELFLVTNDDSVSNVAFYTKYERFNPHEMKKHWLENIIQRMPTKYRCKLIEILGNKYWIEMSE